MDTHLKAFSYRLYPTRAQEAALFEHLSLTRELYNAALEERREAYRKCGKSVSVYEQLRSLVEVKAVRPEFKGIHSHVLQGVVQKLDRAFQAFFRRVKSGETPGYPRFRGRDGWGSFAFKQVWDNGRDTWFGPGKPLDSGRIYLPNIGNVRMRQHRPLEGKPKTLAIKHDAGHWYAIYTCEVAVVPLPETGSSVGIDLGTNPNFLITSDGEFVAAPRLFRQAERQLRQAQRTVARRKRRSSGQRKARVQVAKLHRKVKNQRKDFHHKVARTLVNAHDAIFHEELNVIGLARTRMAKSVLDSGWPSFINILSNKAASAGRRVAGVNPAYTSQDCHVCGHREKHPLSVRDFVCRGCGALHQRDVNAANNVLRRGQDLPLGEGKPLAAPRRPQEPRALALG